VVDAEARCLRRVGPFDSSAVLVEDASGPRSSHVCFVLVIVVGGPSFFIIAKCR